MSILVEHNFGYRLVTKVFEASHIGCVNTVARQASGLYPIQSWRLVIYVFVEYGP